VTQNEYAATATAEKRLREVLEERFDNAVDVGYLADTLLNQAEIEYLPRKKSVSIRLKVPEFAATKSKPATKTEGGTADLPHDTGAVTVLDDPADGQCPRCGGDGCPACSAEPKPATKTEGSTADLPHDTQGPIPNNGNDPQLHAAEEKFEQEHPSVPKPATVGAFLPYQVNPEEYEDDFFTE